MLFVKPMDYEMNKQFYRCERNRKIADFFKAVALTICSGLIFIFLFFGLGM